jgi:indolepyruvate ferredoxin oxidoreductase alpha subunit
MKRRLIMPEVELLAPPGSKALLLGNEAIARGAIEAGLDVASAYPGTPSTEIGEAISSVAEKLGIYFDWAINEKVAAEIAIAASWSGLRSLTMMKHVGMNVAADAIFTLTYAGVVGGMVIVAADDPQAHSSQNEQDSRHFSIAAKIPTLEPSNSQEAKDFTKVAYDISEKYKLPIMIRTTTRISHQRGIVELGEIQERRKKGFFKPDEPDRYLQVGNIAVRHHKELVEKLKKIEEEVSEKEYFNRIIGDESDYGIIASGVSYSYAAEALRRFNLNIKILKIGMSYPFPRKMVSEFLKSCKKVVVVEESDPIMESYVKMIAKDANPSVEIYGRETGHLPWSGEYRPGIVIEAIRKAFGIDLSLPAINPIAAEISKKAPARSPTLCPACPHRSTGYATRRAVKADSIVLGDIGCYALLFQKPFSLAKVSHAMGSSFGFANGFSIATEQPVVAFIGDSTFFHAGIPALVEAAHHNRKAVFMILDNRITAMTGHQPHPGVNYTATGRPAKEIDLEKLVRSIGIEHVEVIDPFDHKRMEKAVRDSLNREGVSVIIARRECALLTVRKLRQKGKIVPYRVDPEKCTYCRVCINTFACPAFVDTGEKVRIDPAVCFGCGACVTVCPYNAIVPSEGSVNWFKEGIGV